MFRFLVQFILAFSVMLGSVGAHALSSDVSTLRPAGDRPTPFPWGTELPFPWNDIRGTWWAQQENFGSYFTFRVVSSHADGLNKLRVRQIDGETCKQIAVGVGIEGADRVVRVQMSGEDERVYRLSVRAFDANRMTVPEVGTGNSYNDQFMVMSIGEIGNRHGTLFREGDAHVVLKKASNGYSVNCNKQ